MRVEADLELCRGHGVCRREAPEVFGVDSELHRVVLLQEQPGEERREAVERAVRRCPTFAISLLALGSAGGEAER